MNVISETDLQKLNDRELSALREEFRKAVDEAAQKTREAEAILQKAHKARRCRRTLRLNL